MISLKSEDRGLCMNCERATHCTYRTRHSHSVLFCEDFQCETFVASSLQSTLEDARGYSPARSYQKAIGLCLSCDNEPTCQLQTPAAPQARIYCELFE